jgi:type IX secretion system PorP/SprF family membrane protein
MFRNLYILLFGLFFLCLLRTPGPAQQLPLFSIYRENQGLLNPASIHPDFLLYHESYPLSIGVTHRSQWVGSAGKTATQSLRGTFIGVGESSFAPLAGLYLINDKVGPTSFTGFYGRVASIFGLEHPNFGGFSIGLNFGLVQFRIETSEIDLLDPDDILGQKDLSQWHPDVGLGVFYYKNIESHRAETALVYAGVSAAQLIGLDLTFTGDKGEFPFTRNPHFYALAGVYKFLDDFSFLEFSTWTRFVRHTPLDVDLNVRFQNRQKFWIGGGGSLSGNLHAEFGVYLLHLLETGNRGDPPLVKLSAGFDYGVIQYHDQVGKSFEVNLAVLPRWGE